MKLSPNYVEQRVKKLLGENGVPEDFLKEKVNLIMDVWNKNEDGRTKYFRRAGAYWENLLPVLKKYAPEKVETYSRLVGEDFDQVNDEVAKEYDCGSEIANFIASLIYMDDVASSMMTPDAPHEIEIEGEEKYYIPNRALLDTDQYLGRE